MRPGRRLFTVAMAGALTGCVAASATSNAPLPAFLPWKDTGTPPSAVALDREVRYYRDSSGGTWDDRGRKVEPRPGPPEGR
jgi:hypothetical protein